MYLFLCIAVAVTAIYRRRNTTTGTVKYTVDTTYIIQWRAALLKLLY